MRKTAQTSLFGTLLQWIDHLRPRYCCICQHFVADRVESGLLLDLCSSCTAHLMPIHWQVDQSTGAGFLLCTRCGDDQFVTSPIECQQCDSSFLPFEQIVAPYRYDYPLKELIHEFKYRKRRYLGRMLGQLLAQAVLQQLWAGNRAGQGAELPDVLLPVPMDEKKLLARGFSSTAIIAKSCAHALGLKSEPGWARRVIEVGTMAGLPRDVRMLKIRGAYQVSESVAGLHVAIVDDVLTTGATTAELARECLDSGASSVSLWVIARTPSG